MEFSPQALLDGMDAWPRPARLVALVSGGRDSTVLLHALAQVRDSLSAPLHVLHFDHGLSSEAGAWREQVRDGAARLGLPFHAEHLALGAGGAVETRARSARYRRLAEWMHPGDCCLSAHHLDDQAETFLLQALRGAGVAGLAAMPELARFGEGWLGRPLLRWTRAELGTWAQAQHLHWVEDPGNRELAAPRNWLRHRVWPLLTERWPAAARTLARSADLAAEADALVREVASGDLEGVQAGGGDRLRVPDLVALSGPRRRSLLRFWLRARGVPLPSAAKMAELEASLLFADPGGRAALRWPGAEAHRYRGMLHVFQPLPEPPAGSITLTPCRLRDLGALGRVGLVASPGGPLASPPAGFATVEIRFRHGGERLRPSGAAHRRPLKKLLQEAAVLPWMRGRLPLLYLNGELAAVGDLFVAESAAGKGWSLVWENAPPVL